jgi:hypothetical protein
MEKKKYLMKKTEFIESVGFQNKPPASLSDQLQALWWAKKGDWETAHDLAQNAKSIHGDRVHAYLHRVEGDHGNASYWYTRAQESFFEGSLDQEWEHLVEKYLSQ